MTRAARRTPEQMAQDALDATDKRLAVLADRRKRLVGQLTRIAAEWDRLATLRDYQAAHPLLAEPVETEQEEGEPDA